MLIQLLALVWAKPPLWVPIHPTLDKLPTFFQEAPIEYSPGNHVLTGPIHVYYIFYGNLTQHQMETIEWFTNQLGHISYWNVQNKYYSQERLLTTSLQTTLTSDLPTALTSDLQTFSLTSAPSDLQTTSLTSASTSTSIPTTSTITNPDDNPKTYISDEMSVKGIVLDQYSKGNQLQGNDIPDLIQRYIDSKRLPQDPQGLYFVVTSADVVESIRPDMGVASFCLDYCGYHLSTVLTSGLRVPYAFVGLPGACTRGCIRINRKQSPNEDPLLDGALSIIAHELIESTNDPYSDRLEMRAWNDAQFQESADKCMFTFGSTFMTANGATANLRIQDKSFLIQQNWDPETQSCSSSA